MNKEQKRVLSLFEGLLSQKLNLFPEKGGTKAMGVPENPGVYIIYNPRNKVVHVGRTVRGRLNKRLDNHLYDSSTFAVEYLNKKLNKKGSDLRGKYNYRYLVIPNDRKRALVEAYAIGKLCPEHLGLSLLNIKIGK